MGDFIFGFTAPFNGFRILLSNKSLRRAAIFPLLVAITIGTISTIVGLYYLGWLISQSATEIGALLALDPSGYAFMAMTIFLWPVGLLILGVAVYVVVRLVAAPFYSFLAEKALIASGLRTEKSFELRHVPGWLWISARMLAIGLVKVVIFACAAGLFFVFSFVPLLNVLATIGFMHILAYDISDYAFEAMEWPLRQRFRQWRSYPMAYLGFACGISIAMLIPGLNLVMLPANVIGACEILRRTTQRA